MILSVGLGSSGIYFFFKVVLRRVDAFTAIQLLDLIDTVANRLLVLEIDGGRALFPRRILASDRVELVDTLIVLSGVGKVVLRHVLFDLIFRAVVESLNRRVTSQVCRESKVLIVIIADIPVGIQQFRVGPFRRGFEGVCRFVVAIPGHLNVVFHLVVLREMGLLEEAWLFGSHEGVSGEHRDCLSKFL